MRLLIGSCGGVGIPTLVLVDEENEIISRNARFVVANDVEGKVRNTESVYYPFPLLPSRLFAFMAG